MYINAQVAAERAARMPLEAIVVAYRYQVVSVGMWRGQIKRWNTTIHMPTSTSTPNVLLTMQRSGFKLAGDVVGACSGGVASISVYGPAGGAPLSVATYFDWQVPTTWIPYTGEAWSAVPVGTTLDASGESAAVVVGHMAGLSTTGKPITTRKYLHHIPSRTAAAFSDPDIDAATQAKLAGYWAGLMANPAGTAPASITVEPYYGNHQRVRGRRRTVTQVAAQSFSAGVVTGTAATAGGGSGSSQFQ